MFKFRTRFLIFLTFMATISTLLCSAGLPLKWVWLADNRGDRPLQIPNVYPKLLDVANAQKPEFVMLGGDFFVGYTNDTVLLEKEWDQWLAVTKKHLSVPFYLVPGNHDIYNDVSLSVFKHRSIKHLPNYSFTEKDCLFVVLNSEETYGKRFITPIQVEWLRSTLKTANAGLVKPRATFVMLHRPFWIEMRHGWFKHVHPILKEYNVKYVFAGHEHIYFKDKTVDDIRYIVAGGGGAVLRKIQPKAGLFHHFLLIQVDQNDKINVSVVKEDGSIHPEDVVLK